MKRSVKWRLHNDLKTQLLQLVMSSTTQRIRRIHASLQNYIYKKMKSVNHQMQDKEACALGTIMKLRQENEKYVLAKALNRI